MNAHEANYDIKSVSFALHVIQDCISALKTLGGKANQKMYEDRMEFYTKQLPDDNNPIWQTDQYKLCFQQLENLRRASLSVHPGK